MHGCRKEIDGVVGITHRLLFDYYREKPREPCPARLLRFSSRCPKICAIPTKPLRRSGFRLGVLITPTLKAAGSNPVGHTIEHHPCFELFYRNTGGFLFGKPCGMRLSVFLCTANTYRKRQNCEDVFKLQHRYMNTAFRCKRDDR